MQLVAGVLNSAISASLREVFFAAMIAATKKVTGVTAAAHFVFALRKKE